MLHLLYNSSCNLLEYCDVPMSVDHVYFLHCPPLLYVLNLMKLRTIYAAY